MIGIPLMPKEYFGKLMNGCSYTDTQPREWTPKEIEWVQKLKRDGYSVEQIAESVRRSKVSVQVKLKRIGKENGSYNAEHITEKYDLNERFLEVIKPKSILDLYCGTKSFYKGNNVITNDMDKTIDADYHKDAFKLICELYANNKKFDLIDLDPYGSAYDCFDLAIKMAKKGLVITLGELGHKRFKRLDFVRRHYDISDIEDFTIENIIRHIQKIGERNKKELKVWEYREWRNIGRVYFLVGDFKITEQWDAESKNVVPESKPIVAINNPIQLSMFNEQEGVNNE